MKLRNGVLLGVALFLASVPELVGASVAEPLSVEELTRQASVVVQGRVESMESSWSEDGKRISTKVRLRVLEAWKGAPGETVEVVVPGGSLDGIVQRVQGMAQFDEGEEVVVFLRKPVSQAPFGVVGLSQGKLEIVREPDAQPTVVSKHEGLELIDPPTGRAAAPALPAPEPLARVKERVQSTR
jgi:hypothetical protein